MVTAMSEWKFQKLSEAPLDIIDGDRGKNYPSHNEFSNNGHCLFLSTKNVCVDGFDFSECQFISKERDGLLRKGKLQRNDLVLTTRGTVGNIAFYSNAVPYENIRINSGMVVIRPKADQLYPRFNYYLFRYLKNDFFSFISGSAQPQLPIKDLNKMEVNLPPLSEQKTIAGVLSSLDDKIDLLHRQNKTLEAMAEMLFRQWFVEEADEKCEFRKLDEIAFVQNGYAFNSSDYIENINDCLEVLKMGHIEKGGGLKINPKRDYVPRNDKLSRWILNKGDIVMAMTDMKDNVVILGVPAMIDKDDAYVLNQRVARIFLKSNIKLISQYFLYIQLKNPGFIADLQSKANSGVQVNLSTDAIRSSEIIIPPMKTQVEKGQLIMDSYLKKEKNDIQIRTLEKLRNTLLPKLMIGEVRVTV